MPETKQKNGKLKSAGIKITVVLFWILVWEILSRIVGIELLVPSVPKVFSTLVQLVTTITFWQTAITSIYRILAGFAVGSFLGLILAVITAKSKLIYYFFVPVLSIIKATPIVSFIILALVWIKGGNIPSFISFLMVLPIIWGNVYKGIEQTDYKLLEMAGLYKIPKRKILKEIYFHSILPYFGAAATTSMGLAWKAGIAAEVIATPGFSIGTAIYDSKIYLETPQLFAWSIIVIVLSVILEKGVSKLLKYFIPRGSETFKQRAEISEKDTEINPIEEVSEIIETEEIFQEIDISQKSEKNFLYEYIILNNITAEYNGVDVLKNINTTFPQRGCVCLFGPSGSGKTTLLNIISGLKKPIEGRLEYKENPPEKISYVFQEDRLIPWISVKKNVEIVSDTKLHKSEAKEVEKILGVLGLENAIAKLPDELSGGMKQRVNIARAIAFDAPVILLDEPFKGLDSKIKQKIIEIFLNLKKEKLLILVTHDKEDVKLLADSIIYLA